MAKRSALMQKRRTGPSANTQLCINVRLEKCCVVNDGVRCENPVVLVKNNNGKTERRCLYHINTDKAEINPKIAREMWWA